MLNSITGTLTGSGLDFVLVETSGVEWELSCPSIAVPAFGKTGDRTKVFVWLYHREDQMKLFGFPDEKTRKLFLDLIKVEGIGPRQAIKILSGIRMEELLAALSKDDLGRLERIPGVGKKTAQKLLLSLKGSLVFGKEGGTESVPYADLVQALVDMGFDKKKVVEAISDEAKRLPQGGDEASREQELFKKAIVRLSS
jgi:holliday junction DNA helicase RuvA